MNLLKHFVFISWIFPPLLILFSCSDPKERTLNRQEFLEIYSDLLIVSSELKVSDSIRKSKIFNVFENHNTTEPAFRKAIAKFNEDPKEWKEIYKDVIILLDKKKQDTLIKIDQGK